MRLEEEQRREPVGRADDLVIEDMNGAKVDPTEHQSQLSAIVLLAESGVALQEHLAYPAEADQSDGPDDVDHPEEEIVPAT